MGSRHPLVSVLTPVHNGAEYIEECMASVLRQTHENWTYAVVDNASTDATPDLVDAFARKDSRIRLVRHEEFVEANENHNRALAEMDDDSVYCKLLQGDDWLFPECLERMVERAESSDSIGVVGAYRLRQDTVDLVGLPPGQTMMAGIEILRQSLLGGPYVTGAPTATLLRSEVVRRRTPFYDTRYWHSDTEALYWAFTGSDFGYVHQVLTFTRVQPGTRTSWARWMNTYGPENIRFLLRYGPVALSQAEFDARLGLELRRYVWWHTRQLPKPSRAFNAEFCAFHRAEAKSILEESGGDRRVRTAMRTVLVLLSRRGLLGGRPRRPSAQGPSTS
jgi:glycosyltransferase involved in cell wall biosynthesis